MVTKNKTGEQKSKVKVGKLKLNKETVKDLSRTEQKNIKGGLHNITIEITITRTLDSLNDDCTRDLRR